MQIAVRRIWLPASALCAIVVVQFSSVLDANPFFVGVICINASLLIEWVTPPSILLLGASGTATNELLYELQTGLLYSKTIHLLRENYLDPQRGYDLKLRTLYSTSRSPSGIDWERVISEYMRLCEHVLVDLRTQSKNLETELAMISRLPNKAKVLYLVDNQSDEAAELLDNDCAKRTSNSVNDVIWRLRTGY